MDERLGSFLREEIKEPLGKTFEEIGQVLRETEIGKLLGGGRE